MARILIQAAVMNDKGSIRGNNEDNYLLNGQYMPLERVNDGSFLSLNCREQNQIYAVCDGMGGVEAGEEAAHAAVSEFARRAGEMQRPEAMVRVVQDVSDKIYSNAKDRGIKSGTTLVMCAIRDGMATLLNVGDSRIYRFRGGKLTQVSLDHSEVQRLISMGLITREEAKTHPRRHAINQYLGLPRETRINPHIESGVVLRQNDVYLLCSDGLTDMAPDAAIEQILQNNTDPAAAVRELVHAALQNGGRDNVTAMVLRVAEISGVQHGIPGRGKLYMLLTALQAIVGLGLLATIADFLYYLLKR